MKILLIAGHGGTPYDSGAVGCGYTEAVETRRMANAVAPLLRSYGFEVALYDQSLSLIHILTVTFTVHTTQGDIQSDYEFTGGAA